jgi:catechol 2,3-dioxygenase-like lactoylglutathione lyase family enzyme
VAGPLLSAIDHIVIAVGDLAEAEATYTTLLGRTASWRTAYPEHGTANVVFRLRNMSIELLAAEGDGPVGARLTAMTAASGPQLATIAFRTADVVAAHRRFEAVGLAPTKPASWRSTDRKTGRIRQWRSFRAEAGTHGVRIFVLDEDSSSAIFPFAKPTGDADAAIDGLDHLVVRTGDPERACALYGARLGLDLRLDRTFPDFGARLMFFRCGDAIVEIMHPLNADASAEDSLWGLTWRVANLAGARERLVAAGFDVSPIRPGRKALTEVATVRAAALGAPTLLLAPRSQ